MSADLAGRIAVGTGAGSGPGAAMRGRFAPRPVSPGSGDVRPSCARDGGDDRQVPGRADTRGHRRPSPTAGGSKDVHYRFEVVTVPVSDVDRAKDFYQRLGWRLDADFSFEDGGR